MLARLRVEQGFSSAYSFYNNRGGRKAFSVAFANYLKMEKCLSLPKGRSLEAIVSALGLSPESAGVRELLLAYLGELLGSDRLLAGLKTAPSTDPAPISWLLAENAVRQAVGQRSVQLKLRQYEALAADARSYACHVILANTNGGMAKKDLAAMTGLGPKDLEAALGKLRSAGLAKTTAASASSPLAGKFIAPPEITPALAGVYARLQEYRREWVSRHGKAVENRYLILRASQAKFAQYRTHLADVVAMSAFYGDVAPGPDSAMYLVEGRATRIFGR